VQSGDIRALTITSAERNRQLPEVATVREAGFPTLEVEEWFGVVVSAKTSADTVKHLNAANVRPWAAIASPAARLSSPLRLRPIHPSNSRN